MPIPSPRRLAAGFTLIELTVTIVIATILAAFAMARINTQPFNTEGFANQVAATLRYAQKLAISQRRNVTVTVAGNSVALTYPDAPISGAAVQQPPGTSAFTVSAPSSVTVSVSVGSSPITFNALGKPTGGGVTVAIVGDVTRNILVEAETGYVH